MKQFVEMNDPRIRKYDIIGYSLTLLMSALCVLIVLIDFPLSKSIERDTKIAVNLIDNERIIAPYQDDKKSDDSTLSVDNGSMQKEIRENDFSSNAKLPLEKIDFELIKRKIFANLIFPPLAKQNGWFGTVQLALTINEMGQLISSKINQTSGKKIFDDVVLMAAEKLKFDSLPKPSVTSTLLFDIEFTR